jgi:WD40 repeat protein
MISRCFPGALNPFCRQPVCISSCSDQISLATSSSLVYIYSYSNQNLLFRTKFSPHSKSLSCMVFHPTIPGLLVTGGAPNSRVTLWSIKEKTIEKQTTFNLQRVSLKKHLFQVGKKILNSLILETECIDMAFE